MSEDLAGLTHAGDYPMPGENCAGHPRRRCIRTVTIQLIPADRDALIRIAREEDLEPSTLAQQWIVEQLRDKDAKAS